MNDHKKYPPRKVEGDTRRPKRDDDNADTRRPRRDDDNTDARRPRRDGDNADRPRRSARDGDSFDSRRPARDDRGDDAARRPARDERPGDRPRFNSAERGMERPRPSRPPYAQEGRDDRPGRPGEFHDDRPARGTEPRGAEGALIAIDRDIMKLLVRRATLVSRIRGGREHASTPQAVLAEKTVRLAWEEAALSFSKDPRFTRQLFSLLQELKVISKEEAESRGSFHLAPPKAPVSGTLTGPLSSRATLMWTALAAALGKPLTLAPVLFSDSVTHGCKAFAHMGVGITQNATRHGMGEIVVAEGKPFTLKDTGIHAGDTPLLLYLLAFLAAGSFGTCRITGGSAMKNADLSGLRHTLPLLGARLAHVVPHSHGLPALIECSGVVPREVTVPAGLPLDGVCALLLAPLAWNVPVILNLAELPASVATAALAEVGPLHRETGATVEARGSKLHFTPTPITLPQRHNPPLSPALSAYMLALPAFAGGSITIKGHWPAHLPVSVQAAELLAWGGISLVVEENSVTATHTGIFPASSEDADSSGAMGSRATQMPAMELSPALTPLFFALAARSSRKNNARLVLPGLVSFEDEAELSIAQDFLPRLGLFLEEGTLAVAAGECLNVPWVGPDAYWSMALAISACAAPGLYLANPKVVTAVYPPFWPIYNALPALADPESKAPPKEETDDKPARRRIIAD